MIPLTEPKAKSAPQPNFCYSIKMIKSLILFVILVSSPLILFAKTIPPFEKENYDLISYIARYLQKAPQPQQALNDFKIARNTYLNSNTTLLLPQFSASVRGTKSYSGGSSLTSDPLSYLETSAAGNANWNLISATKFFELDLSKSIYNISRLTTQRQVQDYILQAVNIFYELVLREKEAAIYEEDLAVAKNQYDSDIKYYNNGLKMLSDLLQSEVNYRSAQIQLAEAQTAYLNALKNFNSPIGRAIDAPVKTDDDFNLNTGLLPPLAQDIALAMENNYEAQINKFTLQKENAQKKISRLNKLPSVFLDLFANTGRRFDEHENWRYDYGATAGIRFDLGFFYIDKARDIQNTSTEYENAKLAYEQTARSVRDNLVSARYDLENKMQTLELQKIRLDIARQSYDAVQKKYANGLADATALTLRRQELLTAQVSYARVLCDITLSRFKYKNALGEDLFPKLTEIYEK